MNPENLCQQLLFEVPIIRFHFVSALHYLECCYNEYQVKQTTLLNLKLAFLVRSSLFLER